MFFITLFFISLFFIIGSLAFNKKNNSIIDFITALFVIILVVSFGFSMKAIINRNKSEKEYFNFIKEREIILEMKTNSHKEFEEASKDFDQKLIRKQINIKSFGNMFEFQDKRILNIPLICYENTICKKLN